MEQDVRSGCAERTGGFNQHFRRSLDALCGQERNREPRGDDQQEHGCGERRRHQRQCERHPCDRRNDTGDFQHREHPIIRLVEPADQHAGNHAEHHADNESGDEQTCRIQGVEHDIPAIGDECLHHLRGTREERLWQRLQFGARDIPQGERHAHCETERGPAAIVLAFVSRMQINDAGNRIDNSQNDQQRSICLLPGEQENPQLPLWEAHVGDLREEQTHQLGDDETCDGEHDGHRIRHGGNAWIFRGSTPRAVCIRSLACRQSGRPYCRWHSQVCYQTTHGSSFLA